MSAEKRPGGLTALAVLNFVFGAFGCLTTLGLLATLALPLLGKEIGQESGDQKSQEAVQTLEAMGLGFLGMLAFLLAASAILEIISGIGYLKQKKFLGRTLGNAYAVTSIAYSLSFMAISAQHSENAAGIGTLLSILYPVLTLILLNTTFKEDFIH